jgi:PAS domain S-box-containing protein
VARRLDTELQQPQESDTLVDLTAAERLPILLVDDRVENLRALEAVLEPLGFPLQAATSGAEALRLLLQREFALILLDVRMPELDGLETARLIKGRARTRDIPIVFLTAARDEVADIIRGYGIGALDYVLKPFDPELLRSKVAVFAELEQSRRSLQRSEALLRGAFEAAPIGKTVLDADRRIIRANPAFAGLLDREPNELVGTDVVELTHPGDREVLLGALDRIAVTDPATAVLDPYRIDLRLAASHDVEVWVEAVVSSIEPGESAEPQLLVQWVDLSARRRAEQTRAELLMEQAARAQAETATERLQKLQAFADALESLSLEELLEEIALRLGWLFEAESVEVEVGGEWEEPLIVVAAEGEVRRIERHREGQQSEGWEEVPLRIDRATVGVLRLTLAPGRAFTPGEHSLLNEAADRAALSIRRAQLHAEQHRIAVELQRGLIPKSLPEVPGIELAARYEAAGLGAEVGGDWYDAFALPAGRLGIVIGDVAGSGIPAASMMGQLRSVTRAYALAEEGSRPPADVLMRLNEYRPALGEEALFTVLYAILDPKEGTIAWANAGHPPPLLSTRTGESAYLHASEGLMSIPDVTYETHEHEVGTGATLVLYTDGLVERRGEALDMGLSRLAEVVAGGPHDPRALCSHIMEQLLGEDRQLQDDVTAVVARISR